MKNIKCKFCKTRTELETNGKKCRIFHCPKCYARFRYELDVFGLWILTHVQK